MEDSLQSATEKVKSSPKKVCFNSKARADCSCLISKYGMSNKELNLGEVTHYFWRDSKIVLGYIRNDTRRFKTFVVNRIYQIKENADAEHWSYIQTKENPTDDVPKGWNAEWEISNSQWFRGPSFLQQEKKHKPNQYELVELAADDPELKKETNHLLLLSNRKISLSIQTAFS